MSYNDYAAYADSASSFDVGDGVLLLIALAVWAVILVFTYLITLYPRYYMIKTSGVGPAWSAFIPVLNDIQLFKMAGYKWWTYLLYVGAMSLAGIPIVGILFSIGATIFLLVVFWNISANFGLGTCGKILTLFLGWWVYWYVALTKKQYHPIVQNNNPQQGYDPNWYQQQNQNVQDQNWYQQQNQNVQDQNWYQQQNQNNNL